MEKKGKILIADDNGPIREILIKIIEKSFPEYGLGIFEEGESLKNKLEELVRKETDVKLVLTDNQMPKYEGSELIREYSRKINSPMILIYAGAPEIGEQAIEDGAFGYLTKPFEFKEFKELVEKALER